MAAQSDALRDELRQIYGNVVYTHKIHEKEAERASRLNSRLRTVNVIALGVAVLAAVIAPLVTSPVAAWTAAVATAAGLVFGIVQLTLDPAATISENRVAAKAYLEMRDAYLRLVTDLDEGADRAEVVRRREALASRLQLLHDLAPQTSQKAFDKASDEIKAGKTGFDDDELDALFPPSPSGTI